MTWKIYLTGTTTADGALDGTTVIDTTRTEADDYFNNMKLKITSGDYAGEERTVIDWVQSTGTFTVSPAFSGQILAGTTYEVGIYLPRNPNKTALKYAAWFKEYGAGSPIIVSLGTKATVLTIEGLLAYPNKSMANLETDYVDPLKNLLHKEITISAPDTKYDGQWVFTTLNVEERGGVTRCLWYKMEFVKGDTHVVS
jgi:hypothetical protein